MATVSVRYIGNDVDAAIAFYPTHLRFTAGTPYPASGGRNLVQLVELFQPVGAA